MNDILTHAKIQRRLCGEVKSMGPGTAEVELTSTDDMAADAEGLVHGGFIFGQADYAAMLAINEPTVVLGSADVRFVAPVRVGDVVLARAELRDSAGKKRTVSVRATVAGRNVLTGTMTAFVLDQHVLAE